jgi:hypothetical protein
MAKSATSVMSVQPVRGNGYARRRLGCLALAVASALTLAPVPALPSPTELLSHRAVYRMSLASAGQRSEVLAAEGTMTYRFARTCDGWTVENRTELRLAYETGTDTETLWTFTSWESIDGLSFRFRARYSQDGTVVEKLEGQAGLDRAGGAGTAHFTQPEDRVVELPVGTLFPTEHMQQMIRAAERNETTLSRVVFDGASVDNPYLVFAIFNRLPEADALKLGQAASLPWAPAWWTRMAFFPHGTDEPLPEFEIGAHYRADGVADRIVQQFETFSLDVRLKELEKLPFPDC